MSGFLEDAGVRTVGSAGNAVMEARVGALFAASGFAHGETAFTAPAFVPGRTVLEAEGLPPVALLPMHPTLMRPGNFQEPSFTAALVDLGRGTVHDLDAVDGRPLEGVIALMDFDSGDAWQHLLRFGVKGFVFIGGDSFHHLDAMQKLTRAEVSIPRFYVDAHEGARLRAHARGTATPVRVRAEPSRWSHARLRNHWVLIPGSDPAVAQEVAVVVAPMDSNGIVPELAAGGRAGANLFLLTRLLEDFGKRPPPRSVLLAAVNAHTQYYLGERMLAWHLLAPVAEVEQVRNALAADIRYQELMIDTYGRLKLDGSDDAADEERLLSLRTLEDRSTGRNVMVKDPVVSSVRGELNQMKARLLALQRDPSATAAETGSRRDAIRAEISQVVNVLTLFNKVGIKTRLRDLSPVEVSRLRRHVDGVLEGNRRRVELNRADMAEDLRNGAVRDALGDRRVRMALLLDLQWISMQVGFSSQDRPLADSSPWARRFGASTMRIASHLATDGAFPGVRFLDTMTMVGGYPEGYYFPEIGSAVGHFHAAQGTPSVSLRNTFCDAGTAFTPADRPDALDPAVVDVLMAYVPRLLRAILDAPGIFSPAELPAFRPPAMWSVQLRTHEFDPFSAGTLPDLPVPGAMALLYPPHHSAPLTGGDVLAAYMALTDERAASQITGIKESTLPPLPVGAFRIAEDGVTVDRALDAGEIQGRLPSDLSRPDARHTLALFACSELVIDERNDSSSVGATPISAHRYTVLEATQNAPPRRYGTAGLQTDSRKLVPLTSGPGSVFIEPHERVKVITSAKRLAVNATAEEPSGIGFGPGAPPDADFFATAARDMAVLNRDRLKALRGVSNEAIDEALRIGEQRIGEYRLARGAHRHAASLRSLFEALGLQVKAYQEITGTRNDMLKAVVFYMALLLPFCFFIQRLLFKTVKIERQMLLFAGLFVILFAVFRVIHPAFRVAQSPEAIFIAFLMGALGLFVVSILHGRFEGEMQVLFGRLGGGDPAQVGYSTAGQQALLIGVNNMKRRRVRTSLTTATIVLVTFTMLAFSSVSRRMRPTVIPVGRQAPYTGIFYQWPGNQQMDEGSLRTMTTLLAADAGRMVVRRWLMPPATGLANAFRLETDTGTAVQIDGALGLSVAEDGFLGAMPVLEGGRFFSSDHAAEIVLPARAAAALGLSAADAGRVSLLFLGHRLKLAGIVHDDQFRALKDLNRRPILPIQRIQTRYLESQTEASANLDPVALEDDAGVFHVDPASLVILPLETARRLGARPFSVSVRLKESASLWACVNRILGATRARFFVGSAEPFQAGGEEEESGRTLEAGIYYIGSGYRTSVGGLARLLIPLLIAATIILNTMLGSVYERKSEIAVFNAVGLNPTHIGIFFLAEAFVYSVIGSVGGYLIGQGLSLGLARTAFFKGINLNFSSLSVLYVILFTVAVVMLSTLYPAAMATRAAVPSGKRRWSMPAHDGHVMRVVFPFVCQPGQVAMLMAFLHTYLDGFTETSMGDLIATCTGRHHGRDEAGRDTYTLDYEVAPAPFDLGVTQAVRFEAGFDPVVQSYRLRMAITRLSGQDSNWVTVNRPFLDRLRKHLMGWRGLGAGQRDAYAAAATALFGDGTI